MPSRRRRFLGEMLIDSGVINPVQLEEALALQKQGRGGRLGRILIDMGYANEVQICEAIAEQLRIPAADMEAVDIAEEVLAKVSRDVAAKELCLPWFIEGRDLYLIMADPTNVAGADAIAFHTGLRVKPVVAPESQILEALERFYAGEEASLARLGAIPLGQYLSVAVEEAPPETDENLEAAVLGGPVVKLVNAILADAIRVEASDVHVEPQQKGIDLRYRVDGLLTKIMVMPKRIQTKVISRIKVMSHMDIAERRKPQDGRTVVHVGGKSYDLRISTLPTADGEKVVIRVLVQDRARVTLEELGFEQEVLARFKDVLRRPQGLILVTGPTGSGKTSTLYAALNLLRSETTNIVTVEDPVEYRLAGVNQVAVSQKTGLTFAAGLRSILRQDPDVVMVGEIRDLETAQMVFQAAQTGHLVLSTLHTNDAASAITRLVDIGVPTYVIASSLLGVLAQRLVRRLCRCKEPNPDGSASVKGCDSCRFTGFKGRLGVYELLPATARVRSVILARGGDDVVRDAARAAGMKSMFQDGECKVAAGLTVLDEIRRVAPPDESHDPDVMPAVPEQLSSAVRATGPPKILVVDDEPTLLEIIQEILGAEHYEVLVARNGQEALAQVYKERPDLILTDLQMPGMDGMELVKRLRSDLSTCQIPVIFLTVVDSLDTETQAMDLGADDYVTKPFQRGRLLSRIRRSLYRAHLARTTS